MHISLKKKKKEKKIDDFEIAHKMCQFYVRGVVPFKGRELQLYTKCVHFVEERIKYINSNLVQNSLGHMLY